MGASGRCPSVQLVAMALLVCFGRMAVTQRTDWDLAVAVKDGIQLLDFDGKLIDTITYKFTKLKALAFEPINQEFLVSNTDEYNDTIYSIEFAKEINVQPIVADVSDDIQGVAVDPVTQTLYWTDVTHGTIGYVSLQNPNYSLEQFRSFDQQHPQALAIDSCNSYIYWTNSDISQPTIERAHLNSSASPEIVIQTDLFMPSGIAIDQTARRFYWADMKEGIYFTIESAKLDGTERRLVYEGTHQKPYAVAVSHGAIYWTDMNNNALWRKSIDDEKPPAELKTFAKKPMGMVVRNLDFNNCREDLETTRTTSTEATTQAPLETQRSVCLNGEATSRGCKCTRGFAGEQCEISLCHNYCLNGYCYFTTLGQTKCRCFDKFEGNRCERNVCDGFCLNKGVCKYENSTRVPFCECQNGHFGNRCERSVDPGYICELFCQGRETNVLADKRNTFTCTCEQGSYKLSESSENLKAFEFVANEERSLMDQLRNPTSIVLAAICVGLMLATIILTTLVMKRRRPRIKKRIIVNKNVTPLTYRPAQSGQCEITIENCCNMNICETPCFEPPKLCNMTPKDEKKVLLSHMENGEDFY